MSAAFPDERADDLRFRRAACLLSDLEWSEHPDYRTEHALLRILRYPLVGIDHRGRAFIAVAVSSRHGRVPDRVAKRFIAPLLGQEDFARARGLGLAMRLAYSTTGGVIRLLEETCLRRKGQHLELVIPEADKALVGDVVRRRLAALAHHAGCEGRVVFANAGLANA